MAIEVEHLIALAIERTGLDNLGCTSFQEPLERLVDSLNTEANLNAFGTAMASNIITRSLINRLKIEQWWNGHPELDNEVVAKPIIIIGMSRSGTTALSHMLAADRSLRSLLAWEAQDSVPPPSAANYWSDRRYSAAVDVDRNTPFSSTRALHYDPPEAPVECSMIFNSEFQSTGYTTLFHIPTYMRWMMDADTRYLYDYHARVLKLLQSDAPGRWSLKTPQYALDPDQLRVHYPDATFVITHRNPAECIASTSSLMSTFNDMVSDVPRPKEIGVLNVEFFDRKAQRLLAFANRYAGDSIVHIPYAQLISDPMAAVQKVLRAAGHHLNREAEAAIRAQINERPQHSQGMHKYHMSDFGLDKRELEERYKDYISKFDIKIK